LMEQTEKTAGDFANTSDGLANSQRILSAQIENTAAKTGKQLAPALAMVTTALSDIVPVAGNMAAGIATAFEKVVDGAYWMGQQLAEMADALPFVDMLGPIAETLWEQEKLARGTADLVAEYSKGAPTMDEFVASLVEQGIVGHELSLAIIEYRKTLDEATAAQLEAASEGRVYIDVQGNMIDTTDGLTDATGDAAEATEELTRENELLADAIKRTEDRYRALKGELSAEEAFHNAEGMWADLRQSAEEAMTAAEEKTDVAAQAMFDHQGAVIAAKQQIVELGEQYGELPEEEVTKIVALIDEGKLAEAEAAFNHLARERTLYINLQQRGGGGTLPGINPATGRPWAVGATGGIVTRPTMALIGEAGPEAVVPLNRTPGSSPLPAMGGGASSFHVTVNAGLGAAGKEIADVLIGEIKKYERRNGTGWRG